MAEWLVAVDMQNVFAQPDSPWFLPGFDAAADGLAALLPRFAGRTVFTRFVPPARPSGSWNAYYEKWPFALTAPAALWDIAAPLRAEVTVDTHQFSKWTDELRAKLGDAAIVLCGVSTDCCVLATALAAIEHGAHVRVVADACGAKTPALHDTALGFLRLRAPQVTLSTVAAERGAS